MKTRIVGIDTGSRSLGLACVEVEGSKVLALDGTLLSVKGRTTGSKLAHIHEGVESYLTEWSPDEVALEDIFAHTNMRTVMVLARISGVLLFLCEKKGYQPALYPPATVKAAITGLGNATKEQVQYVITSMLKTEPAQSSDVSDAYAVAVCHSFHRRELSR